MSKSAAELLDETNEAISRCLTAQAYTVAEKNKQMADLSQLQGLRRELMKEIQESSHGGQMASVGQMDHPRR